MELNKYSKKTNSSIEDFINNPCLILNPVYDLMYINNLLYVITNDAMLT